MTSEYESRTQAELRQCAVAGRLSYLGKNRDARLIEFDEKYGKGNWIIGWVTGANLAWDTANNSLNGRYVVLDFARACRIYEDAYYEHFKQHPDELEFIVANASEVFDNSPTNINSGVDYLRQEESTTHIQDIAIRNVLARFGRQFEGNELLQIRIDCTGEKWNPANILFHRQDWFVEPRSLKTQEGKDAWWLRDRYAAKEKSVECLWQSNKFLLVRK